MPNTMEEICLKHDNGDAMRFQGRLFSECSNYDEESGSLTRQQLYVTDKGEQIYYIVRSDGKERSRVAYRVAVDGDSCAISNGRESYALDFDSLMLAVRSFCALASDAQPPMSAVEEFLKAANA